MALKFYLLVFLILCLKNVVIGDKCEFELSKLYPESNSLTGLIYAHTESVHKLSMWVYYIYNHFTSADDLIKYLEKLNIHTLGINDHPCFARAVSLYFFFYYLKDIKSMLTTDNYQSFFKNKFKDMNSIFINDFLLILNDKKFMENLDLYILKESNRELLPITKNPFLRVLNKATTSTHATFKSNPYFVVGSRIHTVYTDYFGEFNKHTDPSVVDYARDYNFLIYAGSRENYYNSDIVGPARSINSVISKNKKLGLRKRSSSLALVGSNNNDPLFAFCEKDNKSEYYGSPDDLITSFFSVIKTKMLNSHKKFLRQFDYALFHKTYSIPNLKGFRFLKHLFQKKNLVNFVGMYENHVSTEINFLTEDFVELFDVTMDCYSRQYTNRAAENFKAIRELNIL
ncbi:rhoptry-associated protein 2, putative [Plasmodium sp. gorilla clade G2]|uniref:rhoptry-associated protein 2 n=1 Tax=Plasmodium sp. gorilla clade G2 TaxID=880535 RepID=UPI000D203C36|nr:rhoptry-associated protein 2 [Plasmodium sp. gorilla clade G2]XP_028541360.1 rhoptry-associated protein 2, putative [Plasmodium sp. gorilla clade G2]SOV11536.1 rhoptry-associated protein 2 [Plasmodium sp. gorilla clade G2]SOV20330.1 rhoptry-associated protein 2, putative [Plasmodium sp. gorilla clade G2]